MAEQFDVVDFTTEDHESVVIFTPLTESAEDEMEQMGLEGWQMWGRGFAVDRRTAWNLIDDLLANGFVVA